MKVVVSYDVWMRKAIEDADWKRKWASIYKMVAFDVRGELKYFNAHDSGSDKAIRE